MNSERAAAVLTAAGSKTAKPDVLEVDLEVAGLPGVDGEEKFSLIDLVAWWIQQIHGAEN